MKIFDLTLPERYIMSLNEADTETLIKEADTEHLRLEKEIDETIWPDTPYLNSDGQPARGIWPSEFSYEPVLYRDAIAANPKLERDLYKAADLVKQVAKVKAIAGAARVRRAQITNEQAEQEYYGGYLT